MKNGQYFNKFNWKSLPMNKLNLGQQTTVKKIIKSIELGKRQGLRSIYGGGNRPGIFVPLTETNGTPISNTNLLNQMKKRKITPNRLNQAHVKLTGKGVPPSLLKTLGVSLLLATSVAGTGRAALGPGPRAQAQSQVAPLTSLNGQPFTPPAPNFQRMAALAGEPRYHAGPQFPLA